MPMASALSKTGLYMESVMQSCMDIVPRTETTIALRAASRAMPALETANTSTTCRARERDDAVRTNERTNEKNERTNEKNERTNDDERFRSTALDRARIERESSDAPSSPGKAPIRARVGVSRNDES